MFILFQYKSLGKYLHSKICEIDCQVLPSIDLNAFVLYYTMVNTLFK